jgi:hypothetical protein
MNSHKKVVNKLVKSLDEKRFYTTYGKVVSISTKKLVMLLDLALPLFWLIALMIPERWNKEFVRISVRDR